MFIGVYYGKQEDEAIDVVEREFSQLRTQLTKLKARGPIVLSGDFNAKIKIMENEVKQQTSRNGKMLEDMLNQLDLTPISVKFEHGTWTRELRTSDKQKSVIDYIIIRKSEEGSTTENIVDENGTLRLRGEKESDHNTLALTMKWDTPTETKSIKRWNINNKEGWVKFNQAVQKMDLEKLTNYNKIERELRNIMEETIGSTTVTTGKKQKNKDSDEIRKLRMERKNKQKEFQEAITKNENKKEKLTSYIECQKKLREKIEEEEKTRTKQIMKKIIEEGGTKSNTFWKMSRKAAGKKGTSNYLTITEEGQVLEDPEKAKRYIADYYENLYQARESKPEYAKWTQEITNTVEKIQNSEDMQKTVTPISLEELKQAIRKLKRGKASGPDGMPNKIFTEAQPQTLRIYQIILNRIAMSKNIPRQWKQGQISRLYKGKGRRGKCSNERGITLSSNIGKVFERVLNARTTQEINITENQAGVRKVKQQVTTYYY